MEIKLASFDNGSCLTSRGWPRRWLQNCRRDHTICEDNFRPCFYVKEGILQIGWFNLAEACRFRNLPNFLPIFLTRCQANNESSPENLTVDIILMKILAIFEVPICI